MESDFFPKVLTKPLLFEITMVAPCLIFGWLASKLISFSLFHFPLGLNSIVILHFSLFKTREA